MSSLTASALREAARALEPRVRALRVAPARPTGRYVLYWCTTALRAEENPAFERALVAAHKLAQPLVVYHGLSSRYAHANDRITGFVLEAEPALRAAFEARGARYVFALDRGEPGTRWLDRVADGASVVVTDEFPTYDVRAWAARFAARFDGPVLAVDAACVVPMQSSGRAYERAFAFRERVAPLWRALLEPVVALADPPAFSLNEPLLDALDTAVEPASIADIVASLPIDHTVARSLVLRGGIDAALARWAEFTRGPRAAIDEYAARRNDAADDEGVSRMSAYLHWGMIWAGRLAREAIERESDGARKWLDELLVWRELAWHFCFHNPRHAEPEHGIPAWARETLAQRARPMFAPSELAMELGETGNALWDAAQRRLRRDGYLHNHLRMTWGKQIVAWVHSPSRALAILESLNHRYAIDGRDPASYGGLLWSLGQFDRPHPRTDDFGTVRPRDTKTQSRRLDVRAYGARGLDRHTSLGRVLVVGAGLAGACLARALFDAGVDVTVLEKSKGVGGRIASRRLDGRALSHGAPIVHGSDRRLARWLELLASEGLVSMLDARAARASAPFTAAVRRLLAPLEDRVRCEVRATSIAQRAEGWTVTDADGERYECDRLVLAMPAPQALELARTCIQESSLGRLSAVRYSRTLVALALCEVEGEIVAFDRSIDGDEALSRLIVERVESAPRVAIVAHASEAFCEARYDEGEDGPWGEAMIERARALCGAGAVVARSQKRWRYSRVLSAANEGAPPFATLDDRATLFAIGDGVGFNERRRDADAAWDSASALASWLLAQGDVRSAR